MPGGIWRGYQSSVELAWALAKCGDVECTGSSEAGRSSETFEGWWMGKGKHFGEGQHGEQDLRSLACKVFSVDNCSLMLGFVPASCQSLGLRWISGSRGEECIKQR